MESRQGRKRESNLKDAKDALIKKIESFKYNDIKNNISLEKKNQIGSGMRGDKSRTIRFQDDKIMNHINGKCMSAKKFMKGNMDELWS